MVTEIRTIDVRPETYSYVFNPYLEPIAWLKPHN